MDYVLSASLEEEPDWQEEDEVEEDAFVGTSGLFDDLERPVGPETAGALLEGFEQQQVREALLPQAADTPAGASVAAECGEELLPTCLRHVRDIPKPTRS